MSSDKAIDIQRYDFGSVHKQMTANHYANSAWPIVYILSDENTGTAYVGETTDAPARLRAHLLHKEKRKHSTVHLLTHEAFNKSATLDIESNLIKFMFGDNQFRLLNINVGIAHHNYYRKNERYWPLFVQLWDRLRAEGMCRHSLTHITNSDLFKYSPYKSLSSGQIKDLMTICHALLKGEHKHIVAQGGAGTGKSVLAVFLFKLLKTKADDFNFKEFGDAEQDFIELISNLKKKYPDPEMALVISMEHFRDTMKEVFKNVNGLKASMVIGPAEITRKKYDIVLVDEAHRLRRREGHSQYGSFDAASERLGLDKYTCSEVDWIVKQSSHALFFYDPRQSIKTNDVRHDVFANLLSDKKNLVLSLESQFRIKGGTAYTAFIDRLLRCRLREHEVYRSNDYRFHFFESFAAMREAIVQRDAEAGLARVIGGYAWEWVSQKDKSKIDIEIEGIGMQWNGTLKNWIDSPNALQEMGSIHVIQGRDLNYAGVVFGREISYDKKRNQLVVDPAKYFDKKGKEKTSDPDALLPYILNIYQTLLTRGMDGTYVYACDPALREYLRQHLVSYETKKQLVCVTAMDRNPSKQYAPVYDIAAAAGVFSGEQVPGEIQYVELPAPYRASENLFACRVVGESMNRVIANGDLCLFRKYEGGSRDGEIVLAALTDRQDPDSGSRFTIKEYHSKKISEGDSWKHESINLRPLSTDSSYQEITLTETEIEPVQVIAVFVCVL